MNPRVELKDGCVIIYDETGAAFSSIPIEAREEINMLHRALLDHDRALAADLEVIVRKAERDGQNVSSSGR